VPILPGRRDAHQFIELTAELATEQRCEIVLPAEFERLARGSSSSVLAAACRRVPTRQRGAQLEELRSGRRF
jgi:hypothetical protein